MGKIIYFTGGARSGKSIHSEQYIETRGYQKKIYLATAIAFDEEMKDRIRNHIVRRGDSWKTLEGYRSLVDLVQDEIQEPSSVLLLDCVTNLVSNLLLEIEDDWDHVEVQRVEEIREMILEELRQFLDVMEESPCDSVIVSNEVGMSLVPSYPLGRHFRDICGKANQLVAERAQEAYFVVSGIELRLK